MNTQENRAEARRAFLSAAGWADAQARPLAGDASTRSYERLALDGRRALLMDAPPAAEEAACPPHASADERRRLGYNALARLAGPNLNAFTAIAETLRRAGLSAPEVYAADPVHGFAIIEDLGDDLYVRAIPAGADEQTLYETAVDALLQLRTANPPAPATEAYRMLDYDRAALQAEIALLIEWCWPLKTGGDASSSLQADYFASWAPALEAISAPSSMVLRDYHAENLVWLPDRMGAARVGLIDFQDGLFGSPAYDLVSLLKDARRDVAPELAEAMIRRYCAGAGDGFDEESFRRDYAVLGAQRNAKILGIFARLFRRDGKSRYLDFLPRVEAHFKNDLRAPALRSVRAFFARHMPELAP